MESLIGVAVGTVLTALATWLSDRRQAKRTERKQWHQQRLAAYTTAWTRLSDVALSAGDLAAKYGRPRLLMAPWAPIRALQQAVPIHTALRQATEALTVIRFIGSKDVVDAADRCADVLVQLADHLGNGTATPDRVEAILKEMNERRHHLVDVARGELDVDPRPWRRRRAAARLGGSRERIAALDAKSEPQ